MSNKNLLERAEREQNALDESKAAHVKELKRITDEHDARMKREAAERKRLEDEARAKLEAEFEAELDSEALAMFQAGNPGASEALWKSLRDEMRKRVLLRRSEEAVAAPQHSLYRYIK